MAHHVIHGDETNSVAVRAITDITGPAGGFASVASDPEQTSQSRRRASKRFKLIGGWRKALGILAGTY